MSPEQQMLAGYVLAAVSATAALASGAYFKSGWERSQKAKEVAEAPAAPVTPATSPSTSPDPPSHAKPAPDDKKLEDRAPTLHAASPLTVNNSPGSIIAPSGGTNTVINQSPVPSLEITYEGPWEENGDASFQRKYGLRLLNGGSVSKLTVAAIGEGVEGIAFVGQGMVATGGGSKGLDHASLELLTPLSVRGVIVTSSKPGAIKLESRFD